MTISVNAREATAMGITMPATFFPVARFHPEMDVIQYLTEDCSYRAERVDGILTLLWHPHDSRLVGVALKGFRFLFLQVKKKTGISEDMFLPLVQFLQAALEDGFGEEIMEEAMKQKRQEKYELAKRFTATVGFDAKELRLAA